MPSMSRSPGMRIALVLPGRVITVAKTVTVGLTVLGAGVVGGGVLTLTGEASESMAPVILMPLDEVGRSPSLSHPRYYL